MINSKQSTGEFAVYSYSRSHTLKAFAKIFVFFYRCSLAVISPRNVMGFLFSANNPGLTQLVPEQTKNSHHKLELNVE